MRFTIPPPVITRDASEGALVQCSKKAILLEGPRVHGKSPGMTENLIQDVPVPRDKEPPCAHHNTLARMVAKLRTAADKYVTCSVGPRNELGVSIIVSIRKNWKKNI